MEAPADGALYTFLESRMSSNLAAFAQGSNVRSVRDAAVHLMIRFFRADWSGALLAIVIIAVSVELTTSGASLLNPSNVMTILNNAAGIGVIAGAMTLVILTAGIDLSVGSVLGLCAALTGYLVSFWGFTAAQAILAGLAMGGAIGLIHGVLIARFRMPAFIVTLAGLSIWRGVAHLSTGAKATPELPPTFDWFGRFNPLAPFRAAYKAGELPTPINWLGAFVDDNWTEYFRTFQMSMIIFIVFFVILSVIVSNTLLGRYVFAIGSSESGARQAGINTVRYTILTYFLCSLSAALGGLLVLGRAPYAKSDYGQNWELEAIAAVVIGGTSLFGGRGTIWGTFLGVILLKLINNGLTLAQLNTFWQMIVTGLIILIAVGLDIVRQSRNPESVRRFLAAVATAMAFFALLTPASLWLRAAVMLHEHRSAEALREAGVQLASSQSARLLAPPDLQSAATQMDGSFWPMVLCLAPLGISIAAVATDSRSVGLAVCGVFVVAMVLTASTGMVAASPFLALGAVALAGSLLVGKVFARARQLHEIEI